MTLEFQTGQSVDSPLLAALTSATKEFQKNNPTITIDLIPSTATYESDMKVRLASGGVPDIWWTHGWSLLRYSQFLTPLQDEPWAKYFSPTLASAMKNTAGEFFAFPVDTLVTGIIYNKDVLKAAGVDPTKIISWDDFGRAAQAIKSSGVTPITIGAKQKDPAGNLADWLATGAYTKDQLAQLSAGTFVPGPYTQLLNLIASWSKDGLFNPDYSSASIDDMARALATGKAAFVFSENDAVSKALAFNPNANLGYMPIPSLIGGDPFLISGEMNAFGISKTTKDMKAAKDYIAFLAEPSNEAVLAHSVGALPGLTNVKSDLGVLQSSYDQFVTPGKVPLVPYFDRVYLPNGMWNTMEVTADSVIIGGQAKVSDAVASMSNDFSQLYSQNK